MSQERSPESRRQPKQKANLASENTEDQKIFVEGLNERGEIAEGGKTLESGQTHQEVNGKVVRRRFSAY